MLLYLMRHGIAINRSEPSCPPEEDRHLTPEGIEKTRAAARGLAELGIRAQIMLTSPLLRSVQTAEIVCKVLGYPVKKIRRTDALKPEAKPGQLLAEVARLKADSVMCFGHAPNLDLVIAQAVGSGSVITALKKAGGACLEFESYDASRGLLVWLHTPKSLRLLGE
jgi:phosphohistidine phosphatase